MPQYAAGRRIEPPVSVPSAPRHCAAATATAEPPADPPGTRSVPQGLRVGPNAEFSVEEPMANSSQLVLPTNTAPAPRRRATAVPSYGGTKFSRMREAAVVRTPRVENTSFSAIGMPSSGESGSPRARRWSAAAAWRRASSSLTVRNACSRGSVSAMRSSDASVSSAAESSRRRRRSAAVASVSEERSSFRPPPSLDDLRNPEEVFPAVGGILQQRFDLRPVAYLVVGEHRAGIDRVSGGGHAFGVELVELGDVAENRLKLGRQPLFLLARQRQTGQGGHVAHFLAGDLHSLGGNIGGVKAQFGLVWAIDSALRAR